MNMQRAIGVLGINRTKAMGLSPMVRALKLMPFMNTAEDDERLEAAQFVLRRWNAYQSECNKRRDIRYRR